MNKLTKMKTPKNKLSSDEYKTSVPRYKNKSKIPFADPDGVNA